MSSCKKDMAAARGALCSVVGVDRVDALHEALAEAAVLSAEVVASLADPEADYALAVTGDAVADAMAIVLGSLGVSLCDDTVSGSLSLGRLDPPEEGEAVRIFASADGVAVRISWGQGGESLDVRGGPQELAVIREWAAREGLPSARVSLIAAPEGEPSVLPLGDVESMLEAGFRLVDLAQNPGLLDCQSTVLSFRRADHADASECTVEGPMSPPELELLGTSLAAEGTLLLGARWSPEVSVGPSIDDLLRAAELPGEGDPLTAWLEGAPAPRAHGWHPPELAGLKIYTVASTYFATVRGELSLEDVGAAEACLRTVGPYRLREQGPPRTGAGDPVVEARDVRRLTKGGEARELRALLMPSHPEAGEAGGE